jgi:hypothetical protein
VRLLLVFAKRLSSDDCVTRLATASRPQASSSGCSSAHLFVPGVAASAFAERHLAWRRTELNSFLCLSLHFGIGTLKCASSEGWHDQWEQVPPG